MSDGDFEHEGWSAFDDHGAHGEKNLAARRYEEARVLGKQR